MGGLVIPIKGGSGGKIASLTSVSGFHNGIVTSILVGEIAFSCGGRQKSRSLVGIFAYNIVAEFVEKRGSTRSFPVGKIVSESFARVVRDTDTLSHTKIGRVP